MTEVPIRTKEGMTYQVEQGALPFEMTWWLAQDAQAAELFRNLGHAPGLEDFDRINALMERDPKAIGAAEYIAGRAITCVDEDYAPVIDGSEFNAINLGGWAFNPFQENNSCVTAQVLLPIDTRNYREIRPKATATTILENGKTRSVSQPFLFPGAYTETEIVNKVGAELAMWELLLENRGPAGVPINVPMPVMFGKYPDLKDPQGRPAYYYASRVPNRGFRNGFFLPGTTINDIQDRVEDSIFAAAGARVLHELGLAHNQMVMGNYSAGPMGKMFLADMATLTPLDTTPVRVGENRHSKPTQHGGRGFELSHLVSGSLTRFKLNLDDPLEYARTFINGLMEMYMDIDFLAQQNLNIDVLQNPAIPLDQTLAMYLQKAQYAGLFIPNPNLAAVRNHSWETVNKWREHISTIVS